MSEIEQTINCVDINQEIDGNVANSIEKHESEEIVDAIVTTVTPTTTTSTPLTTPEINEDDQIVNSGVIDETQVESATDDDSINEIIHGKSSITNDDDGNIDEIVKSPKTTNQDSVIITTTPTTIVVTTSTVTPVRSRELKSILALSKEAKLDTNLTHRRKIIDNTNKKDGGHIIMSTKKLLKTTHFPVTAESELDYYDNNEKINNERILKKVGRKRKQSDDVVVSSSSSGIEGAAEMRKNPGLLNLTPLKPNKDVFCWRCHRDGVNVVCETCPRAYHYKCLKQIITDTEHWPCPECVSILKAENTQTRSKAMKGMTLEHLCNLLKYAVKRMIQCDGSEPFIHPVDEKQFPEYKSYIIQPMDLTLLERNIKNNLYGSTQAFEADAKWILHNSIIFNSWCDRNFIKTEVDGKRENLSRIISDQSKLTSIAKTILKICKQEMAEIENCPSCYLNANTKKHTWFVEVCPKPHLLVWAKLKGFPYWPAKMMSFNSTGMVDVRFFGAHDKAWVSTKDCYLYSIKDPNSGKQKRNDIIECVKELEIYVENLKRIYGKIIHAPFKTPIEPGNENKYLKSFLPTYYDVINKNKKEIGGGEQVEDEVVEKNKGDNEKKIENFETNTSDDNKIEQDSTNKIIENVENSLENTTKQIPKSRIEYRYSTGNKPKWVVKPLKNVEIKKRHSSSDIIVDFSKKHCADKITDEIIKTQTSTTASPSSTEEEQQRPPSPPIKFKISDQLIQKLGDLSKQLSKRLENQKNNKDSDDDSNRSHKMDIDVSINAGVAEENPDEIQENSEKIDKDNKITDEIIENADKVSDMIEQEDNLEKSDETEDENDKIDLDIDENNIRNIIHSSLVKPNDTTIDDNVQENTDPIQENDLNVKKRKRIDNDQDDDDDDRPPEKIPKLIPIGKVTEDETTKMDETKQKPSEEKMLINEEINIEKEKETNNNGNNTPEISIIGIKNEAESDEEQDVEYMEAKRQYMSALNISEKQKLPAKPKSNEIRTRSKTEEKRTKTNNNESNQNQINKTINDNRTSESSSSDIESNRKLPLNDNNVKEFYIKSLTKMQTTKHKARKSFPTPNYSKKNLKILPKPLDSSNKTRNCNASLTVLPKLHYNKASTEIDNSMQRSNIPCPPLQPSVTISTNDRTSNESNNNNNSGSSSNLLINTSTITTNLDCLNQFDSELNVLKEILPENVTKSVNEILCQPPPKLKPKPFTLLNSPCDPSIPSSAGPVTSRINSMTQTLNDCFRGLIVEVINDLGKSNNPEATISSLKLEIEELNYRHSIEIGEIRRNVAIMLKDIQKSIIEERKRVINETKANCEIESTKRVEDAKSKQWCANCSKEAQFYCCWNTSYCDYPCQQKHWLKHMSKCTQVTNQNQSVISNRPTNQQQTSSSGSNPPRFRNVLSKPQKVYVKRSSTTPHKGQSSGNHVTLVESTTGNFELIGNGSITVNGKILASSVVEKIQNGDNLVTVSAPTASVELTSANNNNNSNDNSNNNKVTVASKSPLSNDNVASSSDSEH